jgi:hypothetical protein
MVKSEFAPEGAKQLTKAGSRDNVTRLFGVVAVWIHSFCPAQWTSAFSLSEQENPNYAPSGNPIPGPGIGGLG